MAAGPRTSRASRCIVWMEAGQRPQSVAVVRLRPSGPRLRLAVTSCSFSGGVSGVGAWGWRRSFTLVGASSSTQSGRKKASRVSSGSSFAEEPRTREETAPPVRPGDLVAVKARVQTCLESPPVLPTRPSPQIGTEHQPGYRGAEGRPAASRRRLPRQMCWVQRPSDSRSGSSSRHTPARVDRRPRTRLPRRCPLLDLTHPWLQHPRARQRHSQRDADPHPCKWKRCAGRPAHQRGPRRSRSEPRRSGPRTPRTQAAEDRGGAVERRCRSCLACRPWTRGAKCLGRRRASRRRLRGVRPSTIECGRYHRRDGSCVRTRRMALCGRVS